MKTVQWNKQVSICARGTMVFIWMLQHCWRCSVNDLNKTLDTMILAALLAHKRVNRFRQCPSTWDTDGALKQHGQPADSILFGLVHAGCYDNHLSSTWWPRFVFGLTVLHSRTESALSKKSTDIKYTSACVSSKHASPVNTPQTSTGFTG